MSNDIVAQKDFQAIVNGWLEAEANGEKFPVDFDLAWQIAGYSTKGNAMRVLKNTKNGLLEGHDFSVTQGDVSLIRSDKSELSGRSSDCVVLTCDGFKHFCLLAKTEQGRQIRQYFIEAEKKWKMVEKHHPAIASEIEILKLQAEISSNQRFIMERSEFILNTHGKQVLALVQGRPDVVVHDEIVVTEVVDIQSKTSTKILTADQLKKAVKERTGQKIPSQKYFVDSLRKAGRDDLLTPVTRSRTDEYVIPERLDEAIAVVYGRQRQHLIGE